MKGIFVNQVGYLTESEKYFITTSEITSFLITDDNHDYYEGKTKLHKLHDKSTGEKLYIGYFSDFNRPGRYRVVIGDDRSHQFDLGDNIYFNVLDDVINSFYFQRCGAILEKSRVGIFERECCHTGLTPYHPSLGIKGYKDVRGGWHDAGDYGRYITPGAVSVAFMLIAYENYPKNFKNSDLLEEIRYELDWMMKMQESDVKSPMYGAVHYMVNSRDYNWVTPENDISEHFIMGYSSLSTADFAAAMACASRVFMFIDFEYSEILLQRAELAWDFIENNEAYPVGGFLRPDDIKTGGYAINPSVNDLKKEDMLWPLIELYMTTGRSYYHIKFKKLYSEVNITGEMTWIDKTGFAELQYSLAKTGFYEKNLQKSIQSKLIKRCDEYFKVYNDDGFKTVFTPEDYKWGSNGNLMAKTLQLIGCYLITTDEKYRDAALSQLNYIVGLNIHGKSFIAGIGTDSVKSIHHASFENDDIDHCFKGMLTGGPNSYQMEDEELRDRALYSSCPKSTPPAKCYVDDERSFSSNENCIIYSAPLIGVVAFFVN